MSVQSVLLPVLVHVLLVFVVLGGLIVAGQRSDPRAAQFSANLRNQFEMPVLFLTLVILAMVLHRTDLLFVVLEWLYVLARIVHAVIHVTSNRQPARGLASWRARQSWGSAGRSSPSRCSRWRDAAPRHRGPGCQ